MAALKYSNLLATPASVTAARAAVGYNLDGVFSKAVPCGAPVPMFPFLNQGDTETVYARQKYEQAIASYQPPDLTKEMPGITGAYPLGDVNFRDGGCGIWEFERSYGNIPKQRVRGGQSHCYSFQYVLDSGSKITTDPDAGTFSYEGPTYTLGTLPFTVDSTLIYDYFLSGNEGKFPLLQAPQALQIGQKIICRGVDYTGQFNFPLSLYSGVMIGRAPNLRILAEDDTYDDWMGAIRCRVRRTIAAPDLAFWGRNL